MSCRSSAIFHVARVRPLGVKDVVGSSSSTEKQASVDANNTTMANIKEKQIKVTVQKTRRKKLTVPREFLVAVPPSSRCECVCVCVFLLPQSSVHATRHTAVLDPQEALFIQTAAAFEL